MDEHNKEVDDVLDVHSTKIEQLKDKDIELEAAINTHDEVNKDIYSILSAMTDVIDLYDDKLKALDNKDNEIVDVVDTYDVKLNELGIIEGSYFLQSGTCGAIRSALPHL